MLIPIDELNRFRSEISEIVRTVQEQAEEYDSIDFLIDLLASTVIPLVEEQLEAEYDLAYLEGLGGWVSDKPNESTRAEVVWNEVDGKTFADRIAEYAAEDLDKFASKVETLLETDGHRVRSESRLDAGETLSSVGLTVGKTWRGVLDEKERDEHVALEGVTLPLDGLFEINGFTAPAPGLFGVAEYDCNCRCELEIRVLFE